MALPAVIAVLTVTRKRANSTSDPYGNTVKDWTNPSTLDISGCWIGQGTGSEIVEGRQTTVTEQQWWGPFDADVTATDRLAADGVTYEIDGPVLLERDPLGALSHKTARLKVVDE